MAQVGVVKSLDGGVFYAKDSSGNIRELSIGDAISENEVVYGDSSNQTSAKVEMELSGNDIIVLNQAQQQLIDSSLNQVTFGNEEVIFSKGDINTTFENADLSAWNNTTDDVSDDMETAAGDPTQQETQAGEEEPTEEGRVTARFSARDGSSTDVRSDLRDTSFGGGNPQEPQEQIPTELLNPVDTRVPASVITLSDPIVKEGNQITIVATVTNPPQTDLIITLNNGQTITIPAGQTTGSVTFENPNQDDVYKDPEIFEYTIIETTGGGYDDLDTTSTSTVTVVDTIDTTKVTVTAEPVKEGEEIVFNASVINPPKEDLIISVKDKDGNEVTTITIPAGETTGTSTITNPNQDDVYNDGETLEYATEVKEGGEEYEDLEVTPTV
ncbi:immunoglobulin-like domain-containing protein, partial [Aliarcobacter butzleri]|uniref:immunoglobulin-like domain-containing protein n=1 Tax=Aliarcobacter butzleri TaxID=28197 RepID=UPI003B20D395